MGTNGNLFNPQKVKLGITPTLWWNDDFPLMDIGIPFEQCVSEMALALFTDAASATSIQLSPMCWNARSSFAASVSPSPG